MLNKLLSNYSNKDVFLVAVSGGPDSMALLHMLTNYQVKFVVCNVNYLTRNESEYEAKMVEEFAIKHNMIFEGCKVEDNSISNFQDSARVFRYNFFKNIYEKYSAKGLLVAHHLDDAIETYVMQKRRKGIVKHYGISFQTNINEMNVYRPLLNHRKNELLKYCQNNNVPYSLDYTNELPKYQRNIVRFDIKKLNEDEFNKLESEMIIAEKENELFFYEVDKQLNNCLVEEKLDVSLFAKIPNNFRSFVLYCYLQPRIKRSSRVLSKRFLQEVSLQIIETNQANKKYELDKKYYLYQEYGFLHIEPIEDINYCYYLNKDEELITPYFKVVKKGNNKDGIYLSDDEYPIMIRNYQKGDIIYLENGSKKLNRWFIDKKVPLSKRTKIPLLFTRQGKLVYIPRIYKNFERKNLQSTLFMIE